MRTLLLCLAPALLAGCAVTNTGPVPRSDGLYTITRQGEGFWASPIQLTATASQEAEQHCLRLGKRVKVLHTKEIPSGPAGRWPESEILYRCE